MSRSRRPLGPDGPVLDRVFTVAPLVLVGTVGEDGVEDLAPKHMVAPLGDHHVVFACSPTHTTYRNLEHAGAFTVCWPAPDDVLAATLSSMPRDEHGDKVALTALAVAPARVVDAVVFDDAPLVVECALDRIIDGWGHWSLVVGRIVHAEAVPEIVRGVDRDDADVVADAPLLAYVAPGRVASITHTDAFPFHLGWRR